MKLLSIVILALAISGCSNPIANRTPINQMFPSVAGEDLNKNNVNLPSLFQGKTSLVLVGYVQDAQFDIDRWLIGLDMTQTQVAAYELPTIGGMFPRMFETYINEGMRAGIPKSLWGGVITIYDDADKIRLLTGTENPNNARVILLNGEGKITFFYDEGFSVEALNNLRDVLAAISI